jgi:hypothetical protein
MTDAHYILDAQHRAVAVDYETWARWFEQGVDGRRVAHTILPSCEISTIFLSLDHQFGQGPPLLFETMVFGGSLDQECDRYSTWAEAEAGHAAMVRKCERDV